MRAILTAIFCYLFIISTPVLASDGAIQPLWQGVVTSTSFKSSMGKELIISHENGLETKYFGIDIILVTMGQKVTSDDTVAFTRSNSRSLRVEIYKDGELLLVSPVK